jgi:alpha-tubulin suppressor-like RCC1 family protein
VPVAVDDSGALSGASVVQVDSGAWSSCALTDAGSAYCWGRLTPDATPPPAPPVPERIPMTGVLADRTIAKDTNSYGHCALTTAGEVGCWLTATDPVRTLGGALTDRHVVDIEGGVDQGCALTADDILACWRNGTSGEPWIIGPEQVNDTGVLAGKDIVEISAAGTLACALTTDNTVACWDMSADVPSIGNPAPLTPQQVDVASVLGDQPLTTERRRLRSISP